MSDTKPKTKDDESSSSLDPAAGPTSDTLTPEEAEAQGIPTVATVAVKAAAPTAETPGEAAAPTGLAPEVVAQARQRVSEGFFERPASGAVRLPGIGTDPSTAGAVTSPSAETREMAAASAQGKRTVMDGIRPDESAELVRRAEAQRDAVLDASPGTIFDTPRPSDAGVVEPQSAPVGLDAIGAGDLSLGPKAGSDVSASEAASRSMMTSK